MCLQTTWKKPKRASKDKIVYKLLTSTYSSPYADNPITYEIGKLYTTEMLETDDDSSLDSEATQARNRAEREGKKLISLGSGFHSAATKNRLETLGYITVKCIIPKGSLYYRGLTDLLVSNQIKVIKKVV